MIAKFSTFFLSIQIVALTAALMLGGYPSLAHSADATTCVNSAKNAKLTPANLAALCRGAENSAEPGACYARVMGGTISYGGGSSWNPGNAVRLCAGAPDANARVSCFSGKISQGVVWGTAIDQCTGKSATVVPVVLGQKSAPPAKTLPKVPTRPTSGPVDCLTVGNCDGDGVTLAGGDCDDNDANRFPGNEEVADFNGHDEDCNDRTYGVLDTDDDGYTDFRACNGDVCGLDCDDTRASVSPRGAELPNRRDDNCNGVVDDDLENWWNPVK